MPALEAKRSRSKLWFVFFALRQIANLYWQTVRAIECSNCGLSDERIGDLMNKLERQSTSLNICFKNVKLGIEL